MKQGLAAIWSHRPYSLYVMSMVTEATVEGLKKIFPGSLINFGFNYYKNAENTYLYSEKQYLGTANAIAGKALANPQFLLKTLKVAYQKALKLNRFIKRREQKAISGMSDRELLDIVRKFSDQFIDMYAYGTVAILVGYSQDNILYRKAEKIIKNKTKAGAGNFSRLYVALTNQPRLNRNSDFELAIINFSRKIKRARLFSARAIEGKFGKSLENILNEYQWLSYDLCDKANWNPGYVINLVLEKNKQNLQAQADAINKYKNKTGREFKNAVAELKLTNREIKVFESIRNLAYYKWAREYEFTEALFNFKKVQDELARRLGVGTLEMKFLTAPEYPLLFKNINKTKLELSKRIKECLFYYDWRAGQKIISGQEATREWNRIRPKFKAGNGGLVLKGSPAYGGTVRGTVRIINSVRHISRLSHGDILVAVTTNPALLPAMKKAAAIVTNEGGITSHAAIVSRELQIPCIVGAKMATKIFKDGDLVEVDAKHGLMKRVR